MSKHEQKPARPAVPEAVLRRWWEPFEAHLRGERRCSPHTVRNYRQAFEDFQRWLAARGAWEKGFDALQPRDLRDWVIERQHPRDGLAALDRRTLRNHASGLRSFFRYWMRHGKVHRDPLAGIPLPRPEKRLPKFLTETQMVSLLDSPRRLLADGKIDAFAAARDRMLLEILYGGGLRVSELVSLNHGAIDPKSGVARVHGKGRKERLCPLGEEAMKALEEFAGRFAPSRTPEAPVAIRENGTRLTASEIQRLLKRYLAAADLPRDLTPT